MDATESLHESIQQNLGQDLPPIPKHWSWATADQVCLNKISSGGTPTGRMTQDGQVPFLKVYNLTFTGELDFTREPTFIDFETHEKVLKKSRLLPGDVLMNIVGPPLGKVSIVPDDYPEWNMNQAIVFFRTSHLYSNKLLCLWLRGEFAKKFFGQEAKATAGQYNVRTSKCRQLPIPVPPADEQRRIVARIEELTARSKTAKQALQAIPPLLEKFRQSVLAAAFRGDLTADWRLKNVGTPSADTFLAGVREELARNRLDKSQAKRSNDDRQLLGPAGSPALPTGWAWAKLEDITYNLDGRRIPLVASERAKRRGPYPYYGASGVIDGLNDFIFEGPHLLVAEDGANLLSRRTPIAFVADGQFWVNNHAHVLLPAGGLPLAYLEHFINSIDLSFIVTGSAQPKLTQKALNQIVVPIAPVCEQREIAKMVDALFQASNSFAARAFAALTDFSALESTLLAKAFRGELIPTSDESSDSAFGLRQ